MTLLDDLCVESPPIAEKAEVFVSYTGRYKFRFFVESLEGLRGKPVWADLFCVDQFAWSGGKGTPTLDKCRNGLLDGLCSSIHEIGNVVLLLERWDGVVDTVGQSWVFWEMFNAVRANASIRLVLTSAERTRLLTSLRSFQDMVLSQLMEMDMDKLKAANLQDKEAIIDRLRHGEISLHDVSCKICDCVRELFCKEVMSHAQAFLSDTTSSLVEAAVHEPLCDCMADGVPDEGQRTTLKAITNMASVLYAQSKFALCREALKNLRRILGDDRPDTLTCINIMASYLQAQGKLEEAEPLYRAALHNRRRILGDEHPSTLTSIHNMASNLYEQGKLENTEALFRQTLNTGRRILGDDHPNTLKFISNMASFLREQGKLHDAEPLHREALNSHRRILGDDHPDTLTCTK